VASPDIVRATADVASCSVKFSIRLAGGTFDATTTLLIIQIDTDQNVSTGRFGAEYIVSMGDRDGEGNSALIGKSDATASTFVTTGTVPATSVGDGMDVTVPLSMLGNDEGKLNFSVQAFAHLPGMATSSTIDSTPYAAVQ